MICQFFLFNHNWPALGTSGCNLQTEFENPVLGMEAPKEPNSQSAQARDPSGRKERIIWDLVRVITRHEHVCVSSLKENMAEHDCGYFLTR